MSATSRGRARSSPSTPLTDGGIRRDGTYGKYHVAAGYIARWVAVS
jgi:hypothetical protein